MCDFVLFLDEEKNSNQERSRDESFRRRRVTYLPYEKDERKRTVSPDIRLYEAYPGSEVFCLLVLPFLLFIFLRNDD